MKRKPLNQDGQALIELIVFLPLIITLYSVIGGFANSINGSINQQKVTRAYFYYRVQNNSTIPGPGVGKDIYPTWRKFGMFYIGWKQRFENEDRPVMPCYKISIPFRNDPGDTCDTPYDSSSTLWVRVGTVYGVCGATYVNENGKTYRVPDADGLKFSESVDYESCLIRQ